MSFLILTATLMKIKESLWEKARAWERKNLIGLGGPTIREKAKKEKDMLLEKEINTYKLNPKVRTKTLHKAQLQGMTPD